MVISVFASVYSSALNALAKGSPWLATLFLALCLNVTFWEMSSLDYACFSLCPLNAFVWNVILSFYTTDSRKISNQVKLLFAIFYLTFSCFYSCLPSLLHIAVIVMFYI